MYFLKDYSEENTTGDTIAGLVESKLGCPYEQEPQVLIPLIALD